MNVLRINELAPILLLLALAVAACKNDGGPKEVKATDPNDLIRLPVNADGSVDTTKVAKMVFEQSDFTFDTVREGEIVLHEFKFKNTGPVPLVIADAKSSCGCTVPEWPKEPVPPGGEGSIKAKFNTEHKKNDQHKGIRIFANTYPSPVQVDLRGYVIPKPE